ncbi:MAG: hypothetical protein ACLGIJ_10150 [Candidatus Limnocylindria bacterium]
MSHVYTYIALELANERSREVRDAHRAAMLRAGLTPRPSSLRRGAARALAAVSRWSAAIARRLDARAGDDLGRRLAPTE